MAMILVPVFTFTSATPFPGISALSPVLGTALIIASGGQGRIVSPVLKSKGVVAVGLVSYALYLWHWPIMVFIRSVDVEAPAYVMCAGVVVALILAIASYLWIEKPIRGKRTLATRKGAYQFALLFMVITALMIGVSNKSILKDYRLAVVTKVRTFFYGPERELIASRVEREMEYYQKKLNINYMGTSGADDLAREEEVTCSYDKDNTVERLEQCLLVRAKDKNVLVLGDSIGRDTMHAMKRAFPQVNYIMLHQSACPPSDSVETGCFKRLDEILKRIASNVRIEAVVINFRYRPQDWRNVESSLDVVKSLSPNVFMFGVSPMFSKTNVKYIRSLDAAERVPVFIKGTDLSITQWDYWTLADGARAMAQKHGLAFVNVLDFFCPDKKCRLWVGDKVGEPLMVDQQHLSDQGMTEYSNYLKQQPVLRDVL